MRQGLKRADIEKSKAGLMFSQEILELVNQMQKHRGMSSGIIGGKNDFKKPLRDLDIIINNRLSSIKEESTSYPQMFDNDAWEDIHSRWQDKCRNWQSYELFSNIENHTVLIKIILEQVNTLIDRAGLTTGEDFEFNSVARKILRELPELVEYIGQTRALTVYCSSVHTCPTDTKLYLRYLHQKIQEGTSDIEISMTIPTELGSKVKCLLDLVEAEILEVEKITIDANVLFQLCTEIIDAYLELTKEAINELKNKIINKRY
jgi:hypothetical protein